MDEIFVDIKGYENRYAVSNFGRVLNLKTRHILKATLAYKEANLRISLYKRGKSKSYNLYYLVLKHFKAAERGKHFGVHLDLNRINNIEPNLKWATRGDLRRERFEIKKKKRGVYSWKFKNFNYFRAVIQHKKKVQTIGYFKTEIEAYDAFFNKYVELYSRAPW